MRLAQILSYMAMFLLVPHVQAAERIDFNRDIRPLLSDNCFACHGPDANHREADLRLDQRDSLLDVERAIVISENPDESELLARIISDDPDAKMPPPGLGKELKTEEIQRIRDWIEQGAQWQEHWAFAPPMRSQLPEVEETSWARNEIDHFIGARLKESGQEPSDEANRRTLIRRLYFDLTGLPPTVDQVNAFCEDTRSDAYEALVDQLLDSPHFGERMAVAWMDQARYADTNGYSIDGGRHMWLWRDWVIDAYNQNLPFDQFVIQQLAGDLLPEATIDQRVATGFNRNHMITHEGGTIAEENIVNYVADRVKTTSEVFLGLTMACAQCHDHKYDPITQQDYYRFFAFFNTLSDRGHDGDGGRNARPQLESSGTNT